MVSRARSLIEQYRNQSARDLLDKAKERARAAAVQLLSPQPPAQPRHALVRAPARPALGDRPVIDVIGDQEALAGVCATIALRDLNLVDSLLAQLEQLEASEDDPDALAQLYGLDHLATRLRRNAENLRVLAGQEAGGSSDETSSLLDVIRAALSSIEQYPRVEVGRVAPLAVVGFAADDISRLLAELLDNATTQSPPTVTVLVSAHLTERGSVLLRVEDAGIGMPDERQQELNDWLTEPPLLDSGAIEHMGLAVVRRLAHKHNARVTL
ncbi:MAG TPA: ATP-binding protein, partial [Pseudonocardiaceae bacterium]|nr:ATP-binding protein [Pseudonocardiaceae bacterium]